MADWYAALGDVSFAVQMVMSELVTNAIEADASRLSLALDAHHSYLRIEVTDDAPGLPVEQEPEPDLSHGRGLMIVGALSSRWGVERQDDGMKTVWAELPLTPGVVPTFACAV